MYHRAAIFILHFSFFIYCVLLFFSAVFVACAGTITVQIIGIGGIKPLFITQPQRFLVQDVDFLTKLAENFDAEVLYPKPLPVGRWGPFCITLNVFQASHRDTDW